VRQQEVSCGRVDEDRDAGLVAQPAQSFFGVLAKDQIRTRAARRAKLDECGVEIDEDDGVDERPPFLAYVPMMLRWRSARTRRGAESRRLQSGCKCDGRGSVQGPRCKAVAMVISTLHRECKWGAD
jgi:hypothetical protein